MWKQLPADDHIPAMDYMSALAVKIVTTTQLGPYFQVSIAAVARLLTVRCLE